MAEPVTSVKNYFDTLQDRFLPAAAKGVTAVFQFDIAGDGGGTYHIKVDNETLEVAEGAAEAPTATIKMDAENYIKMVNGKLNGAMAYMRGMMKVSGNVLLLQKMQAFLPPNK